MIKKAKTKEEIDEALKIRYDVQLKPLGIPESDVKKHDINDKPITLIYINDDGKIIASSTAFPIGEKESELAYLAVLPKYQGKGIGREMVRGMEDEVRKRGIKKNIILARTYLKDFYGSLGYTPFGRIERHEGFAEKGVFHQKMRKDL